MKNIWFLIIGFSIFYSCRTDDNDVSVGNTIACKDLDRENTGGAQIIGGFVTEGPQFKAPNFNPLNQNEFVYGYEDRDSRTFKLIKATINGSNTKELAEDVRLISQPKWSKKGWIAFDNYYNGNYEIGLVKPNGDSLTQHTNSRYNLYPVWNQLGNELYWQYSPVLGVPTYFLNSNVKQQTIDTIYGSGDINEGFIAYGDISLGGQLLGETYINRETTLGLAKLPAKALKNVMIDDSFISPGGFIGLDGLTWSNNEQIAYFTLYGSGIYKINVVTGFYEEIMDFCGSKSYKNIDCSADGNFLGSRSFYGD